ncbi:MAG: NAD(+)/NADH kinase [Candidatus Margulisbacteria bacterium]|nr:NAD(+)/NADH kinase [Candidatus Margulisiibacteriota bacterium]
MKTVGVIYKKEDQLIAGTAQQVIKELKSKGYKVSLEKADFVITLGGDGTILRAARLLLGKDLPILGVHMGGLGFLSEIDLHNLNDALETVKKGKYSIDARSMIEALVSGKKIAALNDIVIGKSGIARVMRIELEGISEFVTDGIIFSSATGSTAYNLSAGGPILSPQSKSMIVSAICPHAISTRPLVLERPVAAIINRGKESILTADGQVLIPLHEGQKIRVQPSKQQTKFLRINPYDFFARIEKAFAFGARP